MNKAKPLSSESQLSLGLEPPRNTQRIVQYEKRKSFIASGPPQFMDQRLIDKKKFQQYLDMQAQDRSLFKSSEK